MYELISKYKHRIADAQRLIKYYEGRNMGGACLSFAGQIQAYNAVISDLENLNKEK